MRIRLLGGFAVERDGRPLRATWRLRKARTLVKLLALTPDQRLHRDVLLDTLWPDQDPASAVNNLHQALHVARRALAENGEHTRLLELRDDVVVLMSDGLVDVDVRRFDRLAALARASGEVTDLRAAVAQYTGDLLPEDRFEDWAVRPRQELRERYRDLLVDLAEATGAAAGPGHEAEALDALQRALTTDPLHEPAVRGLMRQLAAAGRRSDALGRYERLRTDLRTTYGTDPDPETRRVYRDLLTGSTEVEEPQAVEPLPRHNLVPMLTTFVGRERELADVQQLLSPGGLLTLTGVGGAGKTRLAEETARRRVSAYPDGAWVAHLLPVADPRLVADTVATALGFDPAGGSDPLRALVARLAPRTLLLVLDNCEHLLGACADLVLAVRRGCPAVTVLATSREPLHVAGEVTFRVPSLELPEPGDAVDRDRLGELASVRLFLDRAGDVRPGFALDATNAPAVVEICRRLDGIPLALELAAARVSHLEAPEIAERLGEALSLLGRQSDVTRHATLRAALEWSHSLLSEDEQVLLRRLAVFAGGFSLPSAEQVCADEGPLPRGEVLDCLGRLVDKSLVQVEPGGPRSRYRLLETIRQLAQERLGAAGEIHALDAAHCRHFLELAAAQDPERATGVVVERPQQLDAEHDNLRAALGWALGNDHDRALLLGVSLWRYWLARGHFVEGTDWLERILQLPVPPSRNRARAVLGLALLDTRRGRGERLKELADTFVTVNEQYGDRADVVYARLVRGILLLSGPDLDEVESTATSVLVEAELLGAAPVASVARSLAAMAALFREDLAVARRRFAECLTQLATVDPASPPFFPVATLSMPLIPVQGRVVPVFEESWLPGRRVGALQARGYTLSALADAHRLAGDLDGALDAVHDSADAFGAIHDPAGTAHALNHLGCVERDRGLFEPADGHLREALRIRRELGDRRGESLALANLGLLSAAAGELVDGRRLAALALERARDVEDGPGSAGALLNLAVVELYAGEPHAARPLVEQAVEAFRPQRYVRLEAWARLLAAELARAGDKPAAIRNGRAAAELFARIDCRIGTARARDLLEDLGALEGVGEGGAKAR